MNAVYDFFETCIAIVLGASLVNIWTYALLEGILESNVGVEKGKKLRTETKRFLLTKKCLMYIQENPVLYRTIKFLWWITAILLLITGASVVIFSVGCGLEYSQYQIINELLHELVSKLLYIVVVCLYIHFFLYYIYSNWSIPNQSDIQKEIEKKREHYGLQNASKRFQWKLAPDNPDMPLKEREYQLGKNEIRVRTAVLKLYDCVEQRGFLPYDGMTEELDDLYGRLVQIEQRCMELNLDFDVTYYGCGYWVFPLWIYTTFTKHHQMLKRGSKILKARQLRQMKKQIQQLCYDIAESFEKSAQIQYYSELQLHDSEVALDLLKEMNQTLKHAARQTSNQKMEQWALEVDKAIAEISSMLENRKILIRNIQNCTE